MKKIRIIALMSILMLLCSSMTVFASQPKVMVTDYRVKENKVVAGSEFHIDITMKNTGSRTVKNLKITISSEGDEIIPANGVGSVYLSELAEGAEEVVTFAMKAAAGLEEKAYKLTVSTEYDDPWGDMYTSTDMIYVPVSIEQRASITDVFTEGTVTLGDSVEILGQVNNMGVGTLYNVKASVNCGFLTETDTYIGNVEPGKSGSIDLLTNAQATTSEKGDMITIVVTYEDKNGNETTLERMCVLTVEAPVYDNVEKIKDDTDTVNKKLITSIAIGVVAVILIIILALKKRKRKKEILEEFDD